MASDWAKAAVNQPSANHVGRAVERIIEREATMASEMPETVRLIDEDGILKFPAEQVGTEYVLATTHQRTLEALREALDEVRETLKISNWGALAKIDDALARIKEATDGR